MLRKLLVGSAHYIQRSLWFRLGPQASWGEDSPEGCQERQETSGGGRSSQTLGAFAPPVDNWRGLRSSLQHTSARRAGGGSLERERERERREVSEAKEEVMILAHSSDAPKVAD
jgi:hypothetical protein